MFKKSCSISVIDLRFMKFKLNRGNWSKMTLRYKICLFTIKLFEDHGIKVDRVELLSLRIFILELHVLALECWRIPIDSSLAR